MIRPKIYVIHTYGRRHGLSDKECEANVWKSIAYGRQLINKGWNPFLPNLFHFVHLNWDKSPEESIYFDIVSSWIRECKAVLVAEKPAWENSGTHREELMAQDLCLDIYYRIGDVPDYSRGRNYE